MPPRHGGRFIDGDKLAAMMPPWSAAFRTAFFLLFASVCAAAQSSGQQTVQQYYREGQEALAAGHYAQAETEFEKLRQIAPDIAEVHATLGVIYYQERKFEQAVPELRQALKLKPSLSKAGTVLAISLSELGQYSEALPGLEKSFHGSPDPQVKRMCGLQLMRAYTGLGRDSNAVELALELNKLFPNDPEILYHTGRIYGNFAYLTIHKLEEVAPTSIWRHQAAAEAYESQGSTNSAIGEYREVLKLDPNRPNIHYRMGRTLLARWRLTHSPDDLAQASAAFEEELKIDPSNANSAYELGEIDREANRLDQAAEMFEDAIKYYPEFEEACVGLGATLSAEQKPALAIPYLQKAVALNPGDEVAWYRLSLAARAVGNTAEQTRAIAEFKRLHQQNGIEQGIASPTDVTKQQLDSGEKPD